MRASVLKDRECKSDSKDENKTFWETKSKMACVNSKGDAKLMGFVFEKLYAVSDLCWLLVEIMRSGGIITRSKSWFWLKETGWYVLWVHGKEFRLGKLIYNGKASRS